MLAHNLTEVDNIINISYILGGLFVSVSPFVTLFCFPVL